MASFNLGKIKGDKGDKGAKGDKGERGDKGDKGDTGENGYTPIFEVLDTTTLPSGSNARVEIDVTDIKNPQLSFFIPKGADGIDALGDMVSSVYDSHNKLTDIFDYADEKLSAAMRKSGGIFTGEVQAFCNNNQNPCIRNIFISKELPEEAQNGDIAIFLPHENSLTIGDMEIGDYVLVEEDGTDAAYIIADKNYHAQNSVTLIRNETTYRKVSFDRAGENTYSLSTADIFLENIFAQRLDGATKAAILPVEADSALTRSVFLPSKGELQAMSYFLTNSIKAKESQTGQNSTYITRTAYNLQSGAQLYCVNSLGEFATSSPQLPSSLRPIIVLRADSPVENVQYLSERAVRLQQFKRGLYVFDNGNWRECLSDN